MIMKRLLIKYTNWILASLMGLFGFTGCRLFDPSATEYGVPSATYTVKGAVVNEATEVPIAGIRVGYSPEMWDEDAFGSEPEYGRESNAFVLTDANGGFTLSGIMFPNKEILPVYIEDVDEEENGLFQSKMEKIDFSNATHSEKSDSWYNGEYTITTTIKLAEVEIE